MKKEKKPNYQDLATSLESLIDVKNKLIKNQEETIDTCMDAIDMYLDETIQQREDIYSLKVDRIVLLIITFASLILLILK